MNRIPALRSYRDSDECLFERHRAVLRAKVIETALRVDAQEERNVQVVGQRSRETCKKEKQG